MPEEPETGEVDGKPPFLLAFVFIASLFAISWVLRCTIPPEHATGDRKPKTKREVVIHGLSFPSTLIIVIDASGSMGTAGHGEPTPYEYALSEAGRVAQQATDAAEIHFFTFSNALYPDPQGWIKMPDLAALENGMKWLRTNSVDGNTNLLGAMEQLLKIKPDDPLGIIVITDEEPDGYADQVAKQVAALNAERKSPAMIGVIGILPSNDVLGRQMATQNGGAYVRIVPRKPTPTTPAAGVR